MKWDKILANHVSDKSLEHVKKSQNLTAENKQSYQKMGKRLEKTFHQRGYVDGK